MAYLEISFQTPRERTQITALASGCRKDNKGKSCCKCRIKCFFQLCLCLYCVLSGTHQSEQANFCLHPWNVRLKSRSVLVSTATLWERDTWSTPQPVLVLQATPGQLSPGPKQSLMSGVQSLMQQAASTAGAEWQRCHGGTLRRENVKPLSCPQLPVQDQSPKPRSCCLTCKQAECYSSTVWASWQIRQLKSQGIPIVISQFLTNYAFS